MVPKQYHGLCGQKVLDWALEPFLNHPACCGVVVALAPNDTHFQQLAAARHPLVQVVIGGPSRADSVRHALALLPAADDLWVLVHDAVRPCLSSADLERLLNALPEAAHGALLAAPVVDTLKRANGEPFVQATIPRSGLWRALTPQAFPLGLLRRALAQAGACSDEAAAVEALGCKPMLVAGRPDNIKITLAEDLSMAEAILQTRHGQGAAHRPAMQLRIGQGFDAHAFGPGDHVILGGVRIAHSQGIVAHSDGDVLAHALVDAILGAMAKGDIGRHFPENQANQKRSSLDFLRHAAAWLAEAGLVLAHADCTVIAEQPRLAPHVEAMRQTVAGALGVAVSRVSIKATTTDGLGFTGRGEGVGAQAVVLIHQDA